MHVIHPIQTSGKQQGRGTEIERGVREKKREREREIERGKN